MYSSLLLEHFHDPRRVGDVASPAAVGVEGDPTCGDVVQIGLEISGDVIADARFRTLGCAVAIAASDAVCDLVLGLTLTAAEVIDVEDVVEALGGVPEQRGSCAAAALAALRRALRTVRATREGLGEVELEGVEEGGGSQE